MKAKILHSGGEVLEKEKSDKLIANAAKSIFAYCRTRTNTREEAEDLSQDILFELVKTQHNLREDKAFYGFMWAVAGNVYKNWCKKRQKHMSYELYDTISDGSVPLPELLEKESDLMLLHRELDLLTTQNRKVIVMYYFNGEKVSTISKSLNISESMVKFLLFKSRKILKEGMDMERTKGDLSFNPGRLMLTPYGDGCLINLSEFEKNLIAQNILLSCYYERCTIEEISLQMGVAVPYLEKDLQELCESGVLLKKGTRYETAIVIFTKDFSIEAETKTLPMQQEIATIVEQFLEEQLSDVKAIGFHQGGVDDSLLKWRITHLIIEQAVLNKYEKSLNLVYPTKYAGLETFIIGVEDFQCRQTGGGLTTKFNNACGDQIKFIEFFVPSINVPLDFGYFWNKSNRVNIITDIAKGKMDGFSENDMLEVAEFIKNGWVKKDGDALHLCIPVYTAKQYEQVISLMDAVTDKIAKLTGEMIDITTDILIQHTPTSMKKDAKNVSWLKRHDIAMSAPVEIMKNNGTLRKIANNEHPTAYVVLK